MTHIKNLVFAGGGVKGLAYVGALEVLKDQGILDSIENVAGASAGGLTALAVALGATIEEIKDLLRVDFTEFEDGGFAATGRMLHSFGMHPGDRIKSWIGKFIASKLGNFNATFADLHQKVISQGSSPIRKFKELHVMAANLSQKRGEVLSFYTKPRLPLVVAIRITVSYPIFFVPQTFRKNEDNEFVYDTNNQLISDNDGDMYVDGGLANNFPVRLFDIDYPNPETLGLRLDSPQEIANLRDGGKAESVPIKNWSTYSKNLIATAMNAQNAYQDEDNFRTVYINTQQIHAVQFKLTDTQQQQLITAGKDAVRTFLEEGNAEQKQQGMQLVNDKRRQQKHDRYNIYSKTQSIAIPNITEGQEQTSYRLQLIFSIAHNQSSKALEEKIEKHYHRLIQQTDIENITYAKQPMNAGGAYVLLLTFNRKFFNELKKWAEKNNKILEHTFLDEEKLILLKNSLYKARPVWMQSKDKDLARKQMLFERVSMGAIQEAAFLLQQGVSTDYRDAAGDTLLHAAVRSGQEILVKLLLEEYHFPVDIVNNFSDSPLHKAVLSDTTLGITHLLISRGAPINKQNRQGMTPLMEAASKGAFATVQTLVSHGARLDIVDGGGFSAKDKALYFKHKTISDFLETVQPAVTLIPPPPLENPISKP
jgi:NTE family protein